MNFSWPLLLEALHHASVVPFGSDLTFYAMKAFGTYDMKVPVLLSIAGATLGQVVNWYAGRTLIFFEKKGKWHVSAHWYERTRTFFEKYARIMMLFCWLPFVNLLVVASGFLKLPLKKLWPYMVIGLTAHYALALLA